MDYRVVGNWSIYILHSRCSSIYRGEIPPTSHPQCNPSKTKEKGDVLGLALTVKYAVKRKYLCGKTRCHVHHECSWSSPSWLWRCSRLKWSGLAYRSKESQITLIPSFPPSTRFWIIQKRSKTCSGWAARHVISWCQTHASLQVC